MDALIRRRMMMMEAGGSPTPPQPLPYDAEVEYIGTSGTQYIDTGITLASGTTKITCEFNVKFTATSGSSRMVAASVPNYGLQVYTNANRIYNQGSYKSVNTTTTYTVTTNSTATNRNITVNGSSHSVNFNRSVSDGANVYILGYPSGTGSSANWVVYKIYINDVLVFDGKPVRIGSVGYLYDNVSGELFGNDGANSFTIGNDKNS